MVVADADAAMDGVGEVDSNVLVPMVAVDVSVCPAPAMIVLVTVCMATCAPKKPSQSGDNCNCPTANMIFRVEMLLRLGGVEILQQFEDT